MTTINIHEAKTHLSRLIEEAVNGKSFIIAKAGKPLVKVTAIKRADKKPQRIGFLKGQILVPDDFNTLGSEEIAAMFRSDQ
jgi:prevent-host-death family protein